jgi:rod shape determining protein RodA
LNFLPERHSDFIFSVIGEEWGFLGCLAMILMFGLLLARMAHIALSVSEPQGRLLATGIFWWIGYQAFVNMGMVMGLLPVVGVPLPLISYGGTSMVTVWVALGVIQSLHRNFASRNF